MNHAEAPAALSGANSWRTSSFSSGANCVEVADIPGYIGVRDTKRGEASPVLVFTPVEWQAFLAGVRAGEFEA